ncbi:unnamed protein product [Clavelina lepadiformis]|uniref:Uncharacterized protein n=1 Tax=Clavelina lepadiformis TaxID=159417 RepID=A0ABP0GZ29_CLALP
MEATAAARKYAFMLSLPEEVKLEMKCNGQTTAYTKSPSIIGETNRSYVNALVNLGAIAYPKPEDEGTKNNVLHNALIAGLRNKHEAERLVTCNMEVQCPKFLDAVKKLLMMEPAHVQQHGSKIQPIKQVPSACKEMKQMIQDLR